MSTSKKKIEKAITFIKYNSELAFVYGTTEKQLVFHDTASASELLEILEQ